MTDILIAGLGQSWVLKEKEGQFRCPLYEFKGLPWDMLTYYEGGHLHPGKLHAAYGDDVYESDELDGNH